ncbi:MAG: hypothetical protein JHD16_15600 [Solirubrobacteraceae bacterium]|nr:hypothetical protein [Solirubrobacteraceae bacterium]
MSVHVTLRDQTSTGKETGFLELSEVPSKLTLRDLIRTRVREEVALFNADRAKSYRGLVVPEDAVAGADGFHVPTSRRIDWERQADVAIGAFERNGFFVLVDGRQRTDLDEELDLTGPSDIRFVRLAPLVGG